MTAVATSTKRYACAICGKRDRPERMVFSTHTRNRYCRDIDACSRRARRKAKP